MLTTFDAPALDEIDSVEHYKDASGKIKEKTLPMGAKFSSKSTDAKRAEIMAKIELEKSKGIRVPHQPTDDLGDTFAHMSILKDDFEAKLGDIAEKTNGELLSRPGLGIKALDRAVDKIDSDYDHDASRLVDILGCTIAYDTADDLLNGYDAIKANTAFTIRRIKNKFSGSGYGDINMTLEYLGFDYEDDKKVSHHHNGFMVELQLNFKPMLDAKHDGHKPYEEQQKISRKHPKIKRDQWQAGVGGVEQKDIDDWNALELQMNQIYEKGWRQIVEAEGKGGSGSKKSAMDISPDDATYSTAKAALVAKLKTIKTKEFE